MVTTDTIAALERAAARLIARDGILAGINLSEVSEEAGVAGSLLYHHYGNRTNLLRASLVRESGTRAAEYGIPDRRRSLGTWARHWFKTSLGFRRATQLLAIVHLDSALQRSNLSTKIMHRKEETQAALSDIKGDNRLAPGADPIGLQAVMHAVMFGHAMTRRQIAREFQIGVTELDQRVSDTLELLFNSIDHLESETEPKADDSD